MTTPQSFFGSLFKRRSVRKKLHRRKEAKKIDLSKNPIKWRRNAKTKSAVFIFLIFCRFLQVCPEKKPNSRPEITPRLFKIRFDTSGKKMPICPIHLGGSHSGHPLFFSDQYFLLQIYIVHVFFTLVEFLNPCVRLLFFQRIQKHFCLKNCAC